MSIIMTKITWNFDILLVVRNKWTSTLQHFWILHAFSYYACGKLLDIRQKPEKILCQKHLALGKLQNLEILLMPVIVVKALLGWERGHWYTFLGRHSHHGLGSPLEYSWYCLFKETLSLTKTCFCAFWLKVIWAHNFFAVQLRYIELH